MSARSTKGKGRRHAAPELTPEEVKALAAALRAALAPELNEMRRRCRLIEEALKETLGEPLDRTLH